jgi:hypothetical protein
VPATALAAVTVEGAAFAALAVVFAAAAALKLARPRAAMSALATFGVRRRGAQAALLAAVVALEAALAAGLALGWAAAAWIAAATMLAFAALLGRALAAGRRGQPCACFGSRSRVSPLAVVRDLLLGACLVALPFLPATPIATDGWLAIGLTVALLACALLAVAVLALAREVGTLRMAVPAQGALEIEHEGPELGSRAAIADRFEPGPATRLALAVFSSEGCAMCRTLEPSVAALGREPLVALEVFDEVRDADAWRALDVPGSPYAVALDLDGMVLAKGTFNSAAQLESVLATAERRQMAGVGA